ncbi:bifunctional RNase H/acid phosphatase [Longispora albida]|uniref:bifunctional RNase H/acid phosphatase n=1 Tax=Longispora albida TaxID=203523 RepID=UPI00035C710E|nr:bifunctional RNase H/acid phosphatase [Longispora albida]
MRVIVEADGGSRGNPGIAGFGAVVLGADGSTVLAERAEPIGIATNNVAEYSGLVAGLAAALELGAADVLVRMDSKLVVEQMSGRWQIKNDALRVLAAEAAQLASQFGSVRYQWIPRAQNSRADALANKAMDGVVVASAPVGDLSPAPAVRSWTGRMEEPTRLILVRHGETAFTAQGRYSGRGDIPLSERGEAQARAAAERVARLVPDVAAIVSSPLTRTRQTAAAIAERFGGKVAVEPDLIEVDFGDWEGRTFQEVSEGWPSELESWLGSTALPPPGGESFDAVAERVSGVVSRLRAEYPGQTVVLVSHVSPIKVTLRDALEGGPGFLYRMHLDPAGVSLIDTWPDGGVAVRLVNDTSHLA